MTDDLDIGDVGEVRRRVVLPVALSLLSADEFEDVLVEIRPQRRPFSRHEIDALKVMVKASGEWLEVPRAWDVTDHPWDGQWLADEIYALLQEELVVSRLAWGQWREGTFVVPPAKRP